MADLFDALPTGPFQVVVADPPWQFVARSGKGYARSPQRHYPCSSLDDLCKLPVATVMAPDAACIMWTTAPFLPKSFLLLSAWGFEFKSAGAWAKRSRADNGWQFGLGYLYRSAAEFWLLGTRGKPKSASRATRNLIVAPVREHSRKPDQMREDVEALFPGGPYLELFARESGRPGWTAWGNQTDRFHGLSTAPLSLATDGLAVS